MENKLREEIRKTLKPLMDVLIEDDLIRSVETLINKHYVKLDIAKVIDIVEAYDTWQWEEPEDGKKIPAKYLSERFAEYYLKTNTDKEVG